MKHSLTPQSALSSKPSALASLHNICLSIDGRSILHDVSLELHRDQILTIIGPNGAGKSTLLRLLLGLQQADSGEVFQQEKLRIGYVPQKVMIDAQMPLSVRHFVQLGCQQTTQLDKVLEEVGASHVINHPVQAISGGEFQRVLLARALLREPQLLVLDEPAQGVDMNGQAHLYELLDKLVEEHGFGVLMVSHDLHLVMANTDKVLCLNQHICCSGHPEDVSKHPEYMNLFGDLTATKSIAVYTHDHDHEHDLDGHVCPLKEGEKCGIHEAHQHD
jgi:zinc transport system ATP-binding protein